MANELTTTSKLQATFGGEVFVNTTTQHTFNSSATATHASKIKQNVGTAREAVQIGDVDNSNATGEEYILQFYNHDDTNFVTVEVQTGAATYWPAGIMRPGETWGPNRVPKLDGSGYGGYFLDADTAICDVTVVASEAGVPV